jgi:hypothetical protein
MKGKADSSGNEKEGVEEQYEEGSNRKERKNRGVRLPVSRQRGRDLGARKEECLEGDGVSAVPLIVCAIPSAARMGPIKFLGQG